MAHRAQLSHVKMGLGWDHSMQSLIKNRRELHFAGVQREEEGEVMWFILLPHTWDCSFFISSQGICLHGTITLHLLIFCITDCPCNTLLVTCTTLDVLHALIPRMVGRIQVVPPPPSVSALMSWVGGSKHLNIIAATIRQRCPSSAESATNFICVFLASLVGSSKVL